MRHFVAYHNTERMRGPLHEGEPLRLLANKPVDHLRDNVVWFVVGEGESPKRFTSGSVFKVSEVGDTVGDGFKHHAQGSGHVFQPPPALNDMEWFPDFSKAMAHFSLGVLEVKEPRFVEEFIGLASHAGYLRSDGIKTG